MEENPLDLLARAFTATGGVLAGVDQERLAEPTPCRSWDVRQLVNHVVGGPRWASAVLSGGAPPADGEDFADRALLDHYADSVASATAAFGADGALGKQVTMPFGEVSGAFLCTMITGDQFVHAWDIARATGQSTDLDPELAEALLAQLSPVVTDVMRGPDGQAPFGPVVEAPPGASAADRLAAFAGREV